MSRYSRKYDGPPVREIRQTDQDPAKIPPHKKPRTYVLKRTITEVNVRTTVERFVSRAARDQARKDWEKKKVQRQHWWNWERGNESNKRDVSVTYEEFDEQTPV